MQYKFVEQLYIDFFVEGKNQIALGKGTFQNNVGKEDSPFTGAFSC